MPSAFFPSLGGVEELTARLGAGLARLGGRPVVATMRWPLDLPNTETVDGLRVWRGRFGLPEPDTKSLMRFVVGGPPTLIGLVRFLRRNRVSLIHVQCVSSNGLFGLVAARALRVPLVVSLQGELTMDSTRVYQRTKVLPWSLKRLMRSADAVTACSKHTLAEAEAFVGFSTGDRGRVVYNGVDVKEFQQATPHVGRRPYIFALGRHVSQKGFDVMLEAFTRSGAPDTHDLLIAGDGPETGALQGLCARLGIGDQVEFVGRTDRSRTAAFLAGCSFFVLPSRHEPMGIVNLEAMAAGKAVVATRVGGVPEIVREGVTAILVPRGDVTALADAMGRLASDPQLRDQLGSAGAIHAQAFDWRSITTEYLDVYVAARDHRARTRAR